MRNICFWLMVIFSCSVMSQEILQKKELRPRPQLQNKTSSSSSLDQPRHGNSASGNSSAGELGQKIGSTLGQLLSSGPEWDSYSSRIDLGLGWGANYGGVGLKLNYQAPVVFGFTAGLGYNTDYGKEYGNDKKILWNTAIQLWVSDSWNMELGLGPRYYKDLSATQLGVFCMTNYQHHIANRMGVIGGIGFSLSTKSKDNMTPATFEWNLGIVYRLYAD